MLDRKPMAARTESGVSYDPLTLDAIEHRFWREVWESVPGPVAAEHGIELGRFGPVQATVLRELAEVQMINLLLGATEPGAVASGELEAAIGWARERGVDPYIPVTPGLPTSGEVESFLRGAGFEPGYSWMKFVRDTHPPRFSPPGDVEVVELTGPGEEPFAAIVAAGFGLPAWCAELFAGLPGRSGWRCYVARVDGEAQATGAMLLDGGIAEFGMAATLEPARRRGCQAALLHRRIADAAAGCELLFVETGERIPGRPSNSYRNILRASRRPTSAPTGGRPHPKAPPKRGFSVRSVTPIPSL
jgi:GNAT superfamily N-acetyltransferase